MIIAIDPGSEVSAYVVFDTQTKLPIDADILPNNDLLNMLIYQPEYQPTAMFVEMIASYGMPVGATVFDTCVWIGRFIQAWQGPYRKVFRKDVKMYLCGATRAKDANIRQALMDMYGGSREAAIGKKKSPGPLYGFKADMWAALGVAVTAAGVDPTPCRAIQESESNNVTHIVDYM